MLTNNFLQDNWEYYVTHNFYSYDTFKKQLDLIDKELMVKNCIYLTVEERTKWKVERISFKIVYHDSDGRGHHFYDANGEQVFTYNYDRKLGVYYCTPQLEEYQLIKKESARYSREWLKSIVDYGYEDYYHKAQNWFGTGADIDKFAESLYMDKVSRLTLEEMVLRKKMKNSEELYGSPNRILEEQLEYILLDLEGEV